MIKGWIVGDRETVAKLDTFSMVMMSSLKDGVGRLALKLLAYVKEHKLSGQALNVKTGRLRRSINQRVETTATSAYGIVGTNVAYARRHEMGFTGTEQVRAHLRMMKQAFGRMVKNPREIMVSQHPRNVKYPAHSFLRSSLADMEPEIKAGMQQVLADAKRRVFS